MTDTPIGCFEVEDDVLVDVLDPDLETVSVADLEAITIETGGIGPPGEKGDKGDKGDTGAPGVSGASLVFDQSQPQAVWTVVHGLNRFPSVVTVDTAGDQFWADVRYVDVNTVIITLGAPVSGSAYLN